MGHPRWAAQQITEAFPWDTAPRYLLRDRDGIYGHEFTSRVDHMGIKEVKTALCSLTPILPCPSLGRSVRVDPSHVR